MESKTEAISQNRADDEQPYNAENKRECEADDFLSSCRDATGRILKHMQDLPVREFHRFDTNRTALIIIDMVNGFAKDGLLSSEQIEVIIPPIVAFQKRCKEAGIKIIVFADCHDRQSPEFAYYPEHCLMDSEESQVVDEISEVGGFDLIRKNSTNGFHEEQFKNWIANNSHIDRFIVVGDCTDICISQFALSLKTWFNSKNRISEVCVPISMVATFDGENHNSGFTELMALYFMMGGGIDVVKDIR